MIANGWCGLHSQAVNSKLDLVIVKDLSKLAKTTDQGYVIHGTIPVNKIGYLGEGNCGNVYLFPKSMATIEDLRKKDNWTGEPAEAFTGNSNEKLKPNFDNLVSKAVIKTVKKKKKPVKKAIVGNKTHVIPVPDIKSFPKVVKTPKGMQPISNKTSDVKAVPKKVTKKVIIKKPNKK
ncbi:MAG: hypothetical protein IT245_06750 [Bacteroidia bacterium]|nr:hypothetical protein [Bacteroidia bacterium]